MAGRKFYVVENLNNAGSKLAYFEDVNAALERFKELENAPGKMPVLGVQAGMGSMDLIHGVNGNNVLCRDYRRPNGMSEDMKNVLSEITNVVDMFISNGVVSCEYCSEFLIDSARVLVPVSKTKDGFEDGYCEDKILKTAFRHGCDSIDEVFVKGHGWVGYQELRKNTNDYCKDGVISIDALNVVYALKRDMLGVGGRMDISPADFVKMVDNFNKPYALIVWDRQDYNYQYKDQHYFVVASYNDISDAVKAWYDIKAKHQDLVLYVGHMENGRESAVFNGTGNDLEEITYEDAAKIYGFDADKSVDSLIQNATTTSKMMGSQEEVPTRDFDSFDMDK